MIRLGIVDFDTSHVVEFTKRLNHLEIAEEQWVEGAKVVAGFRGTSNIVEEERIQQYTDTLFGFGIELVDRPEDLIGKVDGVLVESQEGGVHLERARPFLEAGMSCYVDKPFACSSADAKEMVRLAEENGCTLFSSSSLRYGLEVVEAQEDESVGKIIGATCWSPASLHPNNPGLFHYGIHAVEPLYAFLGPGCREVSCAFSEGVEVTVGVWDDGRIGTVRGTRAGAHGYGFTVWGEKGVRTGGINAGYIYRELLKNVVAMFTTGEPPLDPRVTVEIVAFIEAAMKSAELGGIRVPIRV